MASTNSTTHYELSQYIGTDKPTYLVDYNQDMSKIDTGIYGAKSKADNNETAIGTLSSLNTTEKSNLVGAINEVNTSATNNATNTGNLQNLTTTEKSNVVGAINELKTEADGNKTDIGTLANLTTTEKSSLVGATNEVNGNVGTLSSLHTSNKSNLVSALNELNDYLNLTDFHDLTNPVILNSSDQVMTGASIPTNRLKVALNSAGTFGKIYGDYNLTGVTGYPRIKFVNTGIKGITEDITITPMGIATSGTSIGTIYAIISPPTGSETSASITFRIGNSNSTSAGFVYPCVYYFTQFGDVNPD